LKVEPDAAFRAGGASWGGVEEEANGQSTDLATNLSK
jgi:hypothetical protein